MRFSCLPLINDDEFIGDDERGTSCRMGFSIPCSPYDEADDIESSSKVFDDVCFTVDINGTENKSRRSVWWSCSERDAVDDDEANDDGNGLSLGMIVRIPSTISNIHSCSSIWIISMFESTLSFNKRLTGLNDVW